MKLAEEITICTVDRDPQRIEIDLRKYLQHALLARAHENKAFSHILIPQFTFVDTDTGEKVDQGDIDFMMSIEKVLEPTTDPKRLRSKIAQKFLDLRDKGELRIEDDKTIYSSKDDNLVQCFSQEYNTLLSHRKAIEGISPEQLRNAFFHKQNSSSKYNKLVPELREISETIIANMGQRFGYSKDIALDTIVFALRKNIIEFSKIIS